MWEVTNEVREQLCLSIICCKSLIVLKSLIEKYLIIRTLTTGKASRGWFHLCWDVIFRCYRCWSMRFGLGIELIELSTLNDHIQCFSFRSYISSNGQ